VTIPPMVTGLIADWPPAGAVHHSRGGGRQLAGGRRHAAGAGAEGALLGAPAAARAVGGSLPGRHARDGALARLRGEFVSNCKHVRVPLCATGRAGTAAAHKGMILSLSADDHFRIRIHIHCLTKQYRKVQARVPAASPRKAAGKPPESHQSHRTATGKQPESRSKVRAWQDEALGAVSRANCGAAADGGAGPFCSLVLAFF